MQHFKTKKKHLTSPGACTCEVFFCLIASHFTCINLDNACLVFKSIRTFSSISVDGEGPGTPASSAPSDSRSVDKSVVFPLASPVSVCVIYGPLDDGRVPEECHSFLKVLPEVLQCVYVMKVPVCLSCGKGLEEMMDGAISAVAVRAFGVWGLSYSVHQGGYGKVVPTAKP